MTDMIYGYEPPTSETQPHMWTLKGLKGGIHIWARENDCKWQEKWGGRYIGGVEYHSPVPVYEWQTADNPDHADCFLLGGPCWHDGSSLYFSERIEPMLRNGPPFSPPIHQFMNAVMFSFYQSHFGVQHKPEDKP